MKLDEGVVLVEHGRVPCFGNQAHEAFFCGCRVGAGDEAEALGYAEMVAIDAESAAAERAEVNDGTAGFGADAWKLLKPVADFFGLVLREEVQRERAVAGGDALQRFFELRSFDFGERNDGDGALDGVDRGVADGFPVAGTGVEGAFQIAHDLVRYGSFGAGAQERVDELCERVPRLARLGLAVVAEEQAVNAGELVGLFRG